MTKFLLTFSLLIFYLTPGNAQEWQSHAIAQGISWKRWHADSLYGHPQHLNLLEVDMQENKAAIAFCRDTLIPTSQLALSADALVAVNGGFFDLSAGGSVTLLKVNGEIIHFSRLKLIEEQSEILQGVMWIDDQGYVTIQQAQPDSFYADSRFYSVLRTGPLLLNEGKIVDLSDRPFNNNRHPRTCACTTAENTLILLTVDGRTAASHGMALPELVLFLKSLGCKNAINLDGGGSTTMWIKGQPEGGIVNMPCDNRRFDHAGERPVANAVLIQKKS